MQRIRITYTKGNELMYTGNLDMHKVWERTFRRAGLKLAYSQGFHPQPRLHQACPLPLGFTSQFELLDFWLDSDDALEKVQADLINALQPGIAVSSLIAIPLQDKPLQTLVTAARYRVFFDENLGMTALNERLSRLKSKESCMRTRRGKEYDLLPLILSIGIAKDDPSALEMTLSATPGAAGRPEEVLDELGIDFTDTHIVRTSLVLAEETGSD